MADSQNNPTEDGGRQQRAGANATAQSKNQSNSTATVTIGCKLPHGLMLDLTEAGKPARRFRVKGMNAANIVGGFGITEGVPRDFWNEWLEKHKLLAFVERGQIFAYDTTASARARAKEVGGELLSGLEPIDKNAKRSKIETLKLTDEVDA